MNFFKAGLLVITLLIFNSCAHHENDKILRVPASGEKCFDVALKIISPVKENSPNRISEAQILLKRNLNEDQSRAILAAHEVGKGEIGKNGKPAGIYNYSFRQLLEKKRILHSAGFSKNEVRLLMEKKIVGDISVDLINAAILADAMEATMQFDIRASGSIEQYTALDSPALVGKKIIVNFFQDQHQPGSNANRYPVPQLILTKEFLDQDSREFISTIKQQSMNADQKFEEVGGWIIFTDQGMYKSNPITSHDPYSMQTLPILNGFEETLENARNQEGQNLRIVDIEFYHTHWERGEAFSVGDLEFQQKYAQKIMKHLTVGGNYSAYAVPVQGEVIFRSSLKKNP